MQEQALRTLLDSAFETYDGRRESAKTLLGFSLVYLTGYFTDPPATFHPELVHALESKTDRRLLVIGFRGSGKSTFGSLALPLWAALEYPEQYPFIILVADSSRQALPPRRYPTRTCVACRTRIARGSGRIRRTERS